MELLLSCMMKKRRTWLDAALFLKLAGPTGFEPAPSDVTGRRYNQLNYGPDHCVRDRRDRA
jgi:hypothetical protein